MRKPSKQVMATIVGAQVVSCLFAWRDLRTRPADHLRGSKKFWRVFITINPGNSIVYWLAGRR